MTTAVANVNPSADQLVASNQAPPSWHLPFFLRGSDSLQKKQRQVLNAARCSTSDWSAGSCTMGHTSTSAHTSPPRDRPPQGVKKVQVDEEVAICVFPQALIQLKNENSVSPTEDADVQRLLSLAAEGSLQEELTQVHEDGWKDAKEWSQRIKKRERRIR